MRSTLFITCALFTALSGAPALAHEPADHGWADGTAEIAQTLNDPLTQYAVAGMLSAMSKAVLDMRVEPFVKSVDGLGGKRMSRLPPDATVADIAGADQAHVREEIVARVPKAMSAMGAMAQAAQQMAPEFERMARQMRQAVPRF